MSKRFKRSRRQRREYDRQLKEIIAALVNHYPGLGNEGQFLYVSATPDALFHANQCLSLWVNFWDYDPPELMISYVPWPAWLAEGAPHYPLPLTCNSPVPRGYPLNDSFLEAKLHAILELYFGERLGLNREEVGP
jgi:hypothetical protein